MVGTRLLPVRPVSVGDVIGGRYRIATVRAGRMYAHAEATDLTTGARVAVQVLDASGEISEAAGLTFLAKGRRAALLEGPHVARVLDVGVTGRGKLWVAREMIPEQTLALALAERGAMSVEAAVDIALDVCDALAEAHAFGLAHGGALIDSVHVDALDGSSRTVKVTDLGTAPVAALLTDASSEEEDALRAPELRQEGRMADARCDVWGVGVLLFTMLTGSPPVTSEGPMHLAGVVDALAEVVDACLAENPILRPHAILSLAEELAPHASRPASALARIEARERANLEVPSRFPATLRMRAEPRFELADDDSCPTLIASSYEALEQERLLSATPPTVRVDTTAPLAPLAPVLVEPPPAETRRASQPSQPPQHLLTPTMPPVALSVAPPPRYSVRSSRDAPTVIMPSRARRKWRAPGYAAVAVSLVVGVVLGVQYARVVATPSAGPPRAAAAFVPTVPPPLLLLPLTSDADAADEGPAPAEPLERPAPAAKPNAPSAPSPLSSPSSAPTSASGSATGLPGAASGAGGFGLPAQLPAER